MKAESSIIHRGKTPPCLTDGYICRGCSGWSAMKKAAEPGGPWQGVLIHCTVTGLTIRPSTGGGE